VRCGACDALRCVRACVRACARARVCVCVCVVLAQDAGDSSPTQRPPSLLLREPHLLHRPCLHHPCPSPRAARRCLHHRRRHLPLSCAGALRPGRAALVAAAAAAGSKAAAAGVAAGGLRQQQAAGCPPVHLHVNGGEWTSVISRLFRRWEPLTSLRRACWCGPAAAARQERSGAGALAPFNHTHLLA
jgi:hypothetical protein